MKIKTHRKVVIRSAIILCLIGLSTILNWQFNGQILQKIFGDVPSMKFNSAIGVVVLGLALLLITDDNSDVKRIFAKICGHFLFWLGILTLSETVFSIDLGIDQIFAKQSEASGSSKFPGRMSSIASICFALSGVFCILYNAGHRRSVFVRHLVLYTIALLSFIALMGYLFGVPEMYYDSLVISIAPHTAAAFFLFSVVALLFYPAIGVTRMFTSGSLGFLMGRKIFLQITFTVLVLGYLRLIVQKYNWIGIDFGIALYTTSFIVIALILVWKNAKQVDSLQNQKNNAEVDVFKLATILDSLPDPILVIDESGIIKLANKKAVDLYEYSKSEFEQLDIRLIFPFLPDNWIENGVIRYIVELTNKHQNQEHPLEACRKNGTRFPFEINSSEIQYFDEKLISITTRDISEQIRQNKQIKQLADIIEYSSDAIYSKNIYGTILTWNRGAEQLFGYTKDEVIGRTSNLLLTDRSSDENDALIVEILNRGMVEQYESKRRKKDGSEVIVSISMAAIKDSNDNISEIASILRNITEKKAYEKLKEEGNRINMLFIQQAPHALAMFDTNMRYLATSKKWLLDYNLSNRKVIGQSHYEVFPEIGEDWKGIHKACLKGQINQRDEAYFERQDGSYQWISWDVRPWYSAEGEVGGLIMYTADITNIKKKEQEKQMIEAILEKTSEVARIGPWEADLTSNKIYWSRIVKEIHQVDKSYEPDLPSLFDFFKEGSSREKIQGAVNDAIKSGTPYDLELQIITKSGINKWVRAIGQAEFRGDTCKKLYGIFQDIDDSIITRKALEKANGELKSLLNAGYVAIIGTDINGVITHFSRGAEKMLQYAASEMVGKATPAKIHLHEKIIERGEELSQNSGRNITGFDIFIEPAKNEDFDSREWTYVRRDGSKFPVQLVTSAIRNNQNEIVGYLGIATDITHLKMVEQKLQNSNDAIATKNLQLLQKNEELEQFAYVAAHDLQEPLRMITGFLSLLKKKYNANLDETAKQYINFSVDAGLRMRDLIRDILEYSRFGVVNNQITDLNILVGEIIQSVKNDLSYPHAIIKCDYLPTLKVDRSAMNQLFSNLINNGLKYQLNSNVPKIEISAEKSGSVWTFRISDNGIGIDPQHYEKVFVIFRRLHDRSTYSGTGIGLATCKKIVGMYGGKIWIEKNGDSGSVFCFTLNFSSDTNTVNLQDV